MKFTKTLLVFAFVAACQNAPPQISVHEAWARATVQGQQQASAYLQVKNDGGQADRLLATRTPRAAMATLHSASTEGGVVRMRETTNGAVVPAHGELLLRPGGNHIMLTGVRNPLRPGEHFQLTLNFASSGDRTVDVAVLAPGASGPGEDPQ